MLHALIDTAISGADAFQGVSALVNVDSPSMASGVRLLSTTTPATPVTGDLLVGSDGEIDYYSGSAFLDQDVSYVHLVNNSGLTLATGTPVILERADLTAGRFTIHGQAGNAPDPFGVTLTSVNPAATCAVAFRGRVQMLMNNLSLNAGGKVVIFGGAVYSQSQAQHGYVPAGAQSETSEVFAIALQPGNFSYGLQNVMLFK